LLEKALGVPVNFTTPLWQKFEWNYTFFCVSRCLPNFSCKRLIYSQIIPAGPAKSPAEKSLPAGDLMGIKKGDRAFY